MGDDTVAARYGSEHIGKLAVAQADDLIPGGEKVGNARFHGAAAGGMDGQNGLRGIEQPTGFFQHILEKFGERGRPVMEHGAGKSIKHSLGNRGRTRSVKDRFAKTFHSKNSFCLCRPACSYKTLSVMLFNWLRLATRCLISRICRRICCSALSSSPSTMACTIALCSAIDWSIRLARSRVL